METKPTYILQKNTPNVKAGAEFIFDGENDYHYTATYAGEQEGYSIATYPKEIVESSPEWFLKKKEEKITVSDLSKYENLVKPVYGKYRYQFCLSQKINGEQYPKIISAIESAINGEEENRVSQVPDLDGIKEWIPIEGNFNVNPRGKHEGKAVIVWNNKTNLPEIAHYYSSCPSNYFSDGTYTKFIIAPKKPKF